MVYVYFFVIRLDFDYVSFILFVANVKMALKFKCKEYDAYQTTRLWEKDEAKKKSIQTRRVQMNILTF